MAETDFSGAEFTNEPALVAAPLEIKVSFGLSLASGILTIIGGFFVVLVSASIPLIVGVENSEAAGAVAALIVIGVLIMLVGVFSLIAAVYVLRGRSWARNTLTVLGVLGIFGVLTEFNANPGTAIAHSVIAIVAIILMFVPNSNAYFRAPHPTV
ncbi:hypothetical protein [Subtercola sp. YIM 133946]|uniref:hypothetical protein n=1 Tax=Subtercola sp. YIM 133946 TaxID=3118909 RepID=UPI002F94DE7A